jgi:hypothetical protein
MSLHYIYSDAVGSTVDITAYCRLYRYQATTHAKEGSVSHSTLVVDDPDAIFDFVGHRRLYTYEDLAPVNNQVVHNGFIQNAKVSRGPYRNGTQRIWTLDLADQNVLLHRRLMNGVDANRSAETDVRRMQALIGLDDGIPMTELNTIDDTLYFSSADPVDMDAVDYRTQPVGTGYINDCAQQSGKNYHCWYRESTGEFSLWYDFAASSNWVSTKRLSNVLSDVDGSTTFAVRLENEAVLDRDYSRVASGIMLPFDGVAVGSNTISGTIYVQNQETTDTFAAIDWLAPSLNVKTKTKALARANRYLEDAAAGDDLITCFVELPAADVNTILAGQRIEARFEHFPGYNVFSWFRILARTVTEISEDPLKAYRLDLELTPMTVLPQQVEQFYTDTQLGSCEASTWPEGAPGAGLTLIGFLAQRGGSTHGATIVPIATTHQVDDCDSDFDVAGTGWTYITSSNVRGGGGGYPITIAKRTSTADDTGFLRWGSLAGLNGTARPRSHQIAVSGLAGTNDTPVVSVNQTTSGSSFVTGNVVVTTAPGWIYAGFSYTKGGPADNPDPDFNLVAVAPAEDLTYGLAYAGFGPRSWFGRLRVLTNGTYTITLVPTGTIVNPTFQAYGSIAVFFPDA